MLVGYYLSNALGRTSGSRYLVPTDWVVLFYFGVGLVQLSIWWAVFIGFRQDAKDTDPSGTWPDAQAGAMDRREYHPGPWSASPGFVGHHGSEDSFLCAILRRQLKN